MVSSTLITRAAWGARPPRSTTPLVASEQRGVCVHYSASGADRVADHDDCAARVRAIQNFHLDVRGWADGAYSWCVCGHGYRFAMRGLGVRTAANGTNTGNDGYHAVCFLGFDNIGRDDVTGKAKQAITDCIATVRARYPKATAVRPHSWFKPTACPGDELRAWITAGLSVPTLTTTTTAEDDMTADEVRAIIAEENAKLYRLLARGVLMDTGQVSAAHQKVSLEAIRDELDELPRQ
jgi:hypothetical protein